jgi:membrane protein DedA with SNARE-associated domain/rhodanese-related sulfurtransferase
MPSWTNSIAQHGYAILIGAVFLEAIGLPVPAALVLLIAGAATAHGLLQLPYALGAALVAMLAGDTLLFLIGRYTGWWLLGALCRMSLNPESCILRSADSFYRRGRQLLVIAKFIPGINTMAPPLAGSMNMPLAQFLPLNLAGAALYIGAYFGVGFLFSDALGAVTRGYQAAGRVLGWVVIALIAAYVVFQLWVWIRERIRERGLPRVTLADPAEAARAVQSGAEIYDVRSHGYFDANAMRIQGSRRLDPHSLHQSNAQLPGDRAVYLYCTCARQATSARVARELHQTLEGKGARIAVIRGGLRAWTKAGFPVEAVPAADMAALPVFK